MRTYYPRNWSLVAVALLILLCGCKAGAGSSDLDFASKDAERRDALERIQRSFHFTEKAKQQYGGMLTTAKWSADDSCPKLGGHYFDCVLVHFTTPTPAQTITWAVLYNASNHQFSQFGFSDESRQNGRALFVQNDSAVPFDSDNNPLK